uniref:C-type lectin domain-containing protein n=1 Tax=Gouania willdenowi TaxID=441366 RepID=A0A8C5H738_GOUWI
VSQSERLSFTFSSTVFDPVYHYVNMKMSWANAQSYCRDKYKDLATFESMEDIQKLKRPILATAQVWIGLRDDPKSWKENLGNAKNSWRWSTTGKPSSTGYSSWANGQPKHFKDKLYCSTVNNHGKMYDAFCGFKRKFICFDGKNFFINFLVISLKHFLKKQHQYNKFLGLFEGSHSILSFRFVIYKKRIMWLKISYFYRYLHSIFTFSAVDSSTLGKKIYTVNETDVSWKDAQSYCRANHKDLAVVENAEELSEVILNVKTFAWFGLYRQPWSWSDGRSSSFRNWNTNQPDEAVNVPEVKMQTVRMKIQSDADLSDPAVSNSILQQVHV